MEGLSRHVYPLDNSVLCVGNVLLYKIAKYFEWFDKGVYYIKSVLIYRVCWMKIWSMSVDYNLLAAAAPSFMHH